MFWPPTMCGCDEVTGRLNGPTRSPGLIPWAGWASFEGLVGRVQPRRFLVRRQETCAWSPGVVRILRRRLRRIRIDAITGVKKRWWSALGEDRPCREAFGFKASQCALRI